MTLQQILYALKISETGSMNKAAAELFVSQPTLTSAVHELETEVGQSLFIRSNRGVVPTEAGRRFLADARSVFNQYQILQDKYSGTDPKRRFAVSTQHFSFAVKCFVSMVQALDPSRYRLAIRETRTLDVIRDVGSGASQIGVLYLSEFNRKYIVKLLDEFGLDFSEITRCQACVYLHKDHPLAGRDALSLEDLAPYPCLSFDQGEDSLFYLAEEILSDNEFERSIKVSDRSTVLNLMIGLNGYTLCPGVVCEELNGDVCRVIPYREDKDNPNRLMEIGYIAKKGALLSRAGQEYIRQLNAYFHPEAEKDEAGSSLKPQNRI